MGKSAVDFDDMQAAENRRREVAVLAGASPRATKYEDSEIKQIIGEYARETLTDAAEKFLEQQKDFALPGYNMVSVGPGNEEDAKKNAEALDQLADLAEEGRKNEYKVTDTSTGLPKQEPVLTDEQKEAKEKREKVAADRRKIEKEARDKQIKNQPKVEVKTPTSNLNPSPIGSGDVRAAAAAKKS